MSSGNTLGTTNDPVIAIGVLAQRVGLSVSAVRKYENEGLVIAHRTRSGRRLFSHEDIERVRYIHHLIQDIGLNMEAIRRIQALLPCWDLLPCDEDTRAKCPAYRESDRPCWTIKSLDCSPRRNECRQCDVYRLGSLCTEDIKRVVHDQSDVQNADMAIKKLLQRRRPKTNKET